MNKPKTMRDLKKAFKPEFKSLIESKYANQLVHRGALGEFYCGELFGLKLAKKPNQPGYDATTKDGKRVEIKTRTFEKPPKTPSSLPINLGACKVVYYVCLSEDMRPTRIFGFTSYELKQFQNHQSKRVSFKEAAENKQNLKYSE